VRGELLTQRHQEIKGISRGKFLGLVLVVASLVVMTFIPVFANAEGPHTETPRCVVINEIRTDNHGWIELVNPTDSEVDLSDWELEFNDNGIWKRAEWIKDVVIGAWGSGNEYLVFEINRNIPNDITSARLIASNGTIVDDTSDLPYNSGMSLARYTNHEGVPIDTDTSGDWYVSFSPTKGYANDSVS
jgi:hypothetical protein